MPMTTQDKVYTVANGLMDTYKEAIQTYDPDIALTGLAYMAAVAVHSFEHDPRIAGTPNAPDIAAGWWTNSFHKFLSALREACASARQRGLN